MFLARVSQAHALGAIPPRAICIPYARTDRQYFRPNPYPVIIPIVYIPTAIKTRAVLLSIAALPPDPHAHTPHGQENGNNETESWGLVVLF
jgi:hypothetical protein